ncbi:MAG: hypothetical protein U0271_22795 [Polyangiaceae bacterium]
MSIEVRSRTLSALAAAALVLASRTALAQAEDPAAADLFQRGRALVKQGDWEKGCELLDASMKRAAAVSTMLNLALCREHEGRVATAWVMVQRALVLNHDTVGEKRRESLETTGKEMLGRLEARLPKLRVVVKPPVEGAKLEEGGAELPIDTEFPLDPGPHELVLTAPGKPEVRRSAELREGEHLVLELTFPESREPDPIPRKVDPDPTPKPHENPDSPTTAEDHTIPIWVWITGAAGLSLGGVAIGFAVDGANANAHLHEVCGDDLVCDEDPSFDPDPDNARKNRGLGISLGFGVGATVGLAASIVGLVLSASRDSATKRSAPNIGVAFWGSAEKPELGVVVSGSLD